MSPLSLISSLLGTFWHESGGCPLLTRFSLLWRCSFSFIFEKKKNSCVFIMVMQTHLYEDHRCRVCKLIGLKLHRISKGGAFNIICDMTPLHWPGQHCDLQNFVRNFDFSAENRFFSKILVLLQVPSKFSTF